MITDKSSTTIFWDDRSSSRVLIHVQHRFSLTQKGDSLLNTNVVQYCGGSNDDRRVQDAFAFHCLGSET